MNEVENAWKEYYDYRHELFSGPGNGCDDYRDIPDEVERKLKKLYSKAVKLEKMRGDTQLVNTVTVSEKYLNGGYFQKLVHIVMD